jgi:hypothetical protein
MEKYFINFKILKRGRKWFQCKINYSDNENRNIKLTAKVLIVEEFKNLTIDDQVNNIFCELEFKRNEFKAIEADREECYAYPTLPLSNFEIIKFDATAEIIKNKLEEASEDILPF